MFRTGVFPFVLLSTFIHAVGVLAAVLIPVPLSLVAEGGQNERIPVRVRIQTSLSSLPPAVKSAAVEESDVSDVVDVVHAAGIARNSRLAEAHWMH